MRICILFSASAVRGEAALRKHGLNKADIRSCRLGKPPQGAQYSPGVALFPEKTQNVPEKSLEVQSYRLEGIGTKTNSTQQAAKDQLKTE
jgi:hypothetical protein